MIRLDKDKIKGTIKTKREYDDSNSSLQKAPEDTPASSSDLEKFSAQVLKKLSEENLPPTPSNFHIYFEKLLETKSTDFKKMVAQLTDGDKVTEEEERIKLEKDVKESFKHTSSMLKTVAGIYKNIKTMVEILHKRKSELQNSSNSLALQNVIANFENDLNQLTSILKNQLVLLKDTYDKAGTVVKDVEEKSVFDPRFGVYNKRYLLQTIEQELASIAKFNHSSVLMFVKIKDADLSRINSSKDAVIILKIISKLLLKTSRRSDIVAHYGEGIFTMILRHTDTKSAARACERIRDMIESTNFFLGEKEVEFDIEIVVAPLIGQKQLEEILYCALENLSKTSRDGQPYIICEYSEDKKK